jgi:multiple sugar transport system permease protein
MTRAIYYVVLSLGLGFFVPLITAIFLDEIPKGKLLYRTLYYLPAVTSGIVTMFIWKRLYAPSPEGFLNGLLSSIGIPDQLWLHDPKMAMLCVILPGIWAGAGPGSLIYLAALKNIPTELYEAGAIEGSSFWQRIWNVTIPSLKPLIIINFVGAFIGAFHAMENILVMTGGGPAHATQTIGMEIFYSAFVFLKFGYATAMAWVLGALLIGFTFYQLRIIKQLKFGATG